MKIEEVNTTEIVPYEHNPRKNDKAVAVVMKSIKNFGFKVPIILDKDNVIIAGHTRLQAAIQLNMGQVPVIRADDLTPEQARAFRIMDNKTQEYAKWDQDLLKYELEGLKDMNVDLDLTGLKETEINRILEPKEEPNKGNKKPKYEIVLGDVWELGEHLLACGDATDAEIYDLIVQEPAAMCYTDPPYGVSYSGTNNPNGRDWEVIEGDDLYELVRCSFTEVKRHLKEKAAFYCFYASRNHTLFETAINKAGLEVRQQLIWHKHHILGHSHYHWCHEPIMYGGHMGHAPTFYGDRIDKTTLNDIDPEKMSPKEMKELIIRIADESTMWKFKKDLAQDYIHPTQKPVNMAIKAILNSSQPGEVVIEPFSGSGSTLMACEETKRRCRAIELSPEFCSHIIERWENKTGRKAQKWQKSV